MGKADTQKMEAHFSVVLVEVPQEGLGETAAALGEALHMHADAAKQVLSTAPVVLFRDLAKPEIRALKPKLIELSRRGVEFRITPRPADSLPSVNWPTKPGFAQSGGGELLPSVTFEWQQHAFVCPGCGEAFVIRPIGKPVITKREEVKTTPTTTPAPAPKPAPPKEEKKPAPPPPKPAPAKTAAKKVEVVEEIEEIQEISEPLEVVDEIEEVQEISEPSEEVEEIEEIQEISDSEPIEEVEEIAEAGNDLEMIDLDEAPKKPAPAAKKPPEKKAAPPPKPEPKKPPERKPAKKGGDDDDGGEIAYSVFLSRIPTPDKQMQAAKMICEIRGVSMGEAKDLAARMVIPVVKDVSKEEAEQCLDRFKKLKIQGRITKKK